MDLAYFKPQYPDFEPRNVWSLQNAFTSAFKVLDPLPQFRATANLGGILRLGELRWPVRTLTRHHRKPRSLGGTAEKNNISRLPPKKHTAWHLLFCNWPPERIAEEINRNVSRSRLSVHRCSSGVKGDTMVVGTTVICDFCFERCMPDDFTTVHLEKSGQPVDFTFHNRNSSDCLSKKIEELRRKFPTSTAAEA